MFLHHFDELNIEDESCKGRNRTACTTLAVCQTIGDEEAILGALLHQLQTFRPTSNYLLQSEYGRLATLDTAIEYGTINEETFVVAFHRILGTGLLTVTFFQHLILQTRGQGNNSVLLGILGQILLASFFVCLTSFSALLADFLLLLSKEFLNNLLSLAALYL